MKQTIWNLKGTNFTLRIGHCKKFYQITLFEILKELAWNIKYRKKFRKCILSISLSFSFYLKIFRRNKSDRSQNRFMKLYNFFLKNKPAVVCNCRTMHILRVVNYEDIFCEFGFLGENVSEWKQNVTMVELLYFDITFRSKAFTS